MIELQALPQKLQRSSDLVQINAFIGHTASSVRGEAWKNWTLTTGPPEVRPFLAWPKPVNERDWKDSRVGYGVILADRPNLRDPSKADDAPEPIRELVRQRDAPVFRYLGNSSNKFRYLRDYGHKADVSVSGTSFGTGKGHLPRYLLIYGSPDAIPWQLQYELNATRAVGRLHLTGDALERYINSLLNGWRECKPKSVVWGTDHGDDDITHLIRRAIVQPLRDAYRSIPELSSSEYFEGDAATTGALVNALRKEKPALIVTASHGQTYPLDDQELMRSLLGAPVDRNYESLQPDSVVDTDTQPGGAIWYAHACCSAGSDSQTIFRGLVDSSSEISLVLDAVAKLGAQISPLPDALLSAKSPVRAFIGHVEPTFDWTLRDPKNGELFSAAIVEGLCDGLFSAPDSEGLDMPVGLAFRNWYARLGGLYTSHDSHVRAYNIGSGDLANMTIDVLAARDIQTCVILGDPTVTVGRPKTK